MISTLRAPVTPVCVISGGSSGIGLATAKKFAREGFDVAICGRNPDSLNAAVRQIQMVQNERAPASQLPSSHQCFAAQVDLKDVQQTRQFAEQVLERFPFVNVLVNNAAVAPLSLFDEISADVFESVINVNLRSVFYLTQIVWQNMKLPRPVVGETSLQFRTVINISSMAAVDPFDGFSMYGASKAWLELLTHSLAKEGASLGIRAYSIRPGAVETPLLRRLFPDFAREQCVAPEEVAETVWHCVASPHQFLSGSAIPVVAGG